MMKMYNTTELNHTVKTFTFQGFFLPMLWFLMDINVHLYLNSNTVICVFTLMYVLLVTSSSVVIVLLIVYVFNKRVTQYISSCKVVPKC